MIVVDNCYIFFLIFHINSPIQYYYKTNGSFTTLDDIIELNLHIIFIYNNMPAKLFSSASYVFTEYFNDEILLLA